MKDGTSEVDMDAIRWTFHTCTPPASLEGIISTMTVTMLHTEQIRVESSPSTMLIELSFLHSVCPDTVCIDLDLVDMAAFECEEVPNHYYRPFIDVGRRVLTLTVDCMLSKVPVVFEGPGAWMSFLSCCKSWNVEPREPDWEITLIRHVRRLKTKFVFG